MTLLGLVQLFLLLHCGQAFRVTGTADQNKTERVEQFHVFVKKIELMGNFVTLGLAWHTETMFCPKGPDDEPLSELLHDKMLTGHDEVTDSEMPKIAPYLPHQCWVTGYAGIGPVGSGFDNTDPFFFYGPHGKQHLHYVGSIDLDLYAHIRGMRKCGNWEPRYYNLLYHNCNYYTKTLMDSLGFKSPTFQAEKLLGSAWIPWQGYLDAKTGHCVGTKCTGLEYQDEKHKVASAGLCDQGKCWDGSDYIPKDHMCSSKTGFFDSVSKGIQNIVSGGPGEVRDNEARALEAEWTSNNDDWDMGNVD